MVIKQIGVPFGSLIFQDPQIVLALTQSLPLLFNYHETVEHVKFLKVDEKIDDLLVRIVYECEEQCCQAHTFAILVRPVTIQAVELLLKVKAAILCALMEVSSFVALRFHFLLQES